MNRLRNVVDSFCVSEKKWGLDTTVACEYSAEKHTTDHIFTNCLFLTPPHSINGLPQFTGCNKLARTFSKKLKQPNKLLDLILWVMSPKRVIWHFKRGNVNFPKTAV